MLPRIRRLNADYQQMAAAFTNHPYIRVAQVRGNPPEAYVLQFNVLGLVPQENDTFVQGNRHQAEIILPLEYPRRPPLCRRITPVFHPNIDPQKICIGDHWSAGQTLKTLAVRIAEMISYQSYNVKSPLNAKAAAWAEQNMDKLPLDRNDFHIGE